MLFEVSFELKTASSFTLNSYDLLEIV